MKWTGVALETKLHDDPGADTDTLPSWVTLLRQERQNRARLRA